jgi:RNA polymerase sigma factor for flagellar operon FliA
VNESGEITDGDGLPVDAWERRSEPEVRELIVLHYWPFLTRVVGRLRQRLPPHVRVEEDDLRTSGIFGLYRAIDRYDPTQGPFMSFASAYIWGAVHDDLRSADWAPRSLRRRQSDMETAVRELTEMLNRSPSDSEIAEHLRWTVHDVLTTREAVRRSRPTSLDVIARGQDQDMYEVVADVHRDHPRDDSSSVINNTVVDWIASLPPVKRVVLVYRYYLDRKTDEVAAVLGITPTQVSALHSEVMEDLHDMLEKVLQQG